MNCKRPKVQHLDVQILCMSNIVFFIILFTGLLYDDSSSLTYEPRKGQSPTLSPANCVTVYLMQTGSDLSLLDISFQYNNNNSLYSIKG